MGIIFSPHLASHIGGTRQAHACSCASARRASAALRFWWLRQFGRMASDQLTSVVCDALSTARNVEVVRRSIPGYCPYFITHNLLGWNFDRHSKCTVAPFQSEAVCSHGSHGNPTKPGVVKGSLQQTAVGKTLQLPMGFSRMAGSTKLHSGCTACEGLDYDVACTACGRAWAHSRRKGARPYAADQAAWDARSRCDLQESGAAAEQYGADRWDEEDEHPSPQEWQDGHGVWHGGGYGEDDAGYEEEGPYEEEGGYGEEDGGYGEEDPGEEEEDGSGSESSSSSSSGEDEQVSHKRPRAEPGPSSASGAPATPEANVLTLQLEVANAKIKALEAQLELANMQRDTALAKAGA